MGGVPGLVDVQRVDAVGGAGEHDLEVTPLLTVEQGGRVEGLQSQRNPQDGLDQLLDDRRDLRDLRSRPPVAAVQPLPA